MESEFILSQADGRPMYLQIIEQIKRRISLGDWPTGFKLPSIREFAVSLRVSVITVKRAYQELESEGVITTQQGKGSFVSMDSQLDVQLREKDMNDHLLQAIYIAESLGLNENDFNLRVKNLFQQVASTNPKEES